MRAPASMVSHVDFPFKILLSKQKIRKRSVEKKITSLRNFQQFWKPFDTFHF